jgi:hypothetical protein
MEGTRGWQKCNRKNHRAYDGVPEPVVEETRCPVWRKFDMHESSRCKKNKVENPFIYLPPIQEVI